MRKAQFFSPFASPYPLPMHTYHVEVLQADPIHFLQNSYENHVQNFRLRKQRAQISIDEDNKAVLSFNT